MGSLTGQPTLPAPPEAISTKGLVLRRPRISDADDIFDSCAADPEVTRYVIWPPYTDRSEVAPFLQSRLARWDSGEEFSWAITRTEEDRVIGMVGCRVREQAADIGYVMSRNYWNRGYITEAAKAVVDGQSRIHLPRLGCLRCREQSFRARSRKSGDATGGNSSALYCSSERVARTAGLLCIFESSLRIRRNPACSRVSTLESRLS